MSASLNVGTAAANRIIVVAGASQGSAAIGTVTVNSVSCTIDATFGSSFVASCPGSSFGSGTQTIVATWASGSFQARGFSVWVASNMTSTTVVQHVAQNTSATLGVTANDFMFAAVNVSGASVPWTGGTTQSPSNTQTINASTNFSADWTIASTNASFTLNPNAANQNSFAAATYH